MCGGHSTPCSHTRRRTQVDLHPSTTPRPRAQESARHSKASALTLAVDGLLSVGSKRCPECGEQEGERDKTTCECTTCECDHQGEDQTHQERTLAHAWGVVVNGVITHPSPTYVKGTVISAVLPTVHMARVRRYVVECGHEKKRGCLHIDAQTQGATTERAQRAHKHKGHHAPPSSPPRLHRAPSWLRDAARSAVHREKRTRWAHTRTKYMEDGRGI